METSDPKKIRDKLIHIATRPRAIHKNKYVIVPSEMKRFREDALFQDQNSRRILELGAGWGEFCATWMEKNPQDEYVAFEIKPERIKRLIKQLNKLECDRVKIVPINFNWFLEEILPDDTFDMIIINFPDPWPKKRHWKHRLVTDQFPERIKTALKKGGVVHLATDYGPYARKMLGIFRKRDDFEPVYPWPNYLRERPEQFPPTRFEEIHQNDGKRSYYQEWRLK